MKKKNKQQQRDERYRSMASEMQRQIALQQFRPNNYSDQVGNVVKTGGRREDYPRWMP